MKPNSIARWFAWTSLVPACILGRGTASAQQPGKLPVIARAQIVYSMVSHHSNLPERVAFYNSQGSPKGNTNYVVPQLVYEPRVTLYNPYDVELRLPRCRIQMSDPPVGFKFKKNNSYLRTEWETGDSFSGIARFQIANESNPEARKSFTLVLVAGLPPNYSGQIVLSPGESRTYSARVESDWTWGSETSGGYTPRSFYDWNQALNFTNVDGRTHNLMGAECIEGLDVRAGFQTDHLSTTGTRPQATRYDFEVGNNWTGGWVAIKTNETVSVEAKGVRTSGSNSSVPDFRLSLLRGIQQDVTADAAEVYDFDIDHLAQPSAGAGVPAIHRTYFAGDLLQYSADVTPGGKSPFALFTIVAKSQALKLRAFQSEEAWPVDDLYETRLEEIDDFSSLELFAGPSDLPPPGTMEVPHVERIGNLLILDLYATPIPGHIFKVKGTDDLNNGFPDEVPFIAIEGPPGSGIYKLQVDISGKGERYFVRVEG